MDHCCLSLVRMSVTRRELHAHAASIPPYLHRCRHSCAIYAAFLPTLEKFGKACQVLLGPEEVHLIQTPQDADGASVTVRLAVVRGSPPPPHSTHPLRLLLRCVRYARQSHSHSSTHPSPHVCKWQDVLFQPRSYRTVSRHFNLICFSVDLSLLLQALRTGAAYGADHLEVKLTQKTVAISGSTAVEIQPVLRFFARVRTWTLRVRQCHACAWFPCWQWHCTTACPSILPPT